MGKSSNNARIVRYPLPRITQPLYRQLYSLNFRGTSPMRRALKLYRSWETACAFIILDRDKRVLAWSLVTPGRGDGLIRASFYVRKSCRRLGLGTALKSAITKEAEARGCLWGYYDHDACSKSFFASTTNAYSVYKPPNVNPKWDGGKWIWPSPRRRTK